MKPTTLRQFITQFIRVPDPAGALVPLQFHPAQDRVIAAIDSVDPRTQTRPYTDILISWPKKAGKSTTTAAIALWELFADTANGPDREVVIVASDLAQSRDVVFNQCVRIIERDPRLSKLAKTTSTEILVNEWVREPRTGGRYLQHHVLRAIPVDTRGSHGGSTAALIADEIHAWDDVGYEILEALAPPPTRPSPLRVFSSYAGLRSQAHRGNVLWDLWQRGLAGTDPRLYASILSGPEAWREIPFISDDYVRRMKAAFEVVPSKYTRLIENSWAQSEHSLITSDELQAATIHVPEPEIGQRGVTYAMGIDLGLTHDWTAVVVGHVDGVDGRYTVDVVRTWRGSPGSPVSVMAVEDEVVQLARRFKCRRIVADQWQSAQLLERLRARGIENARPTTIEPARLDRLTTMLKDLFAKRAIAIPSRELDLREQLEFLEVEEAGTRNRRRDRIKFLPGGRDGAGAHDDLVIALALSAEVLQGEAGRMILPPMQSCLRWENVPQMGPSCYLIRRGPGFYPGDRDPSCSQCPGHVAVRQMYARHLAHGGEPYGSTWEFYRDRVKPNAWVELQRHVSPDI